MSLAGVWVLRTLANKTQRNGLLTGLTVRSVLCVLGLWILGGFLVHLLNAPRAMHNEAAANARDRKMERDEARLIVQRYRDRVRLFRLLTQDAQQVPVGRLILRPDFANDIANLRALCLNIATHLRQHGEEETAVRIEDLRKELSVPQFDNGEDVAERMAGLLRGCIGPGSVNTG